jgi:hypothetical protein
MNMDHVLILNVGGVLEGAAFRLVPTDALPPSPRAIAARVEPRGLGGRRAARGRAQAAQAVKHALLAGSCDELPPAFVAIACESLVALAGQAGYIHAPEGEGGVGAGGPEGMEHLGRVGDIDAERVPIAVVRKAGAAPFALLPMNSFLFQVSESSRLRRLGGVA